MGGMVSLKRSLRVSFDPQQSAGVQPERKERYAMPTPMRAKVSLHTSPGKGSPLPLGTSMALDAAAEPAEAEPAEAAAAEAEAAEEEAAAAEEEAAVAQGAAEAAEEAAPKDRRSSKGVKKARFSSTGPADETSSTRKPVRPSTAQTPCAAEAKRRASKTPKTKKERTPGTVQGAQLPAEAAQHSVSITREWVSMSGSTLTLTLT